MASQRTGSRRRSKPGLVTRLTFLLMLAQVSGLVAQERDIAVRMTTEDPVVGAQFQVEFFVPVAGLTVDDIVLPDLDDRLRYLPGESAQTSSERVPEGSIERGTLFRVPLQPSSAGRAVIDPIVILTPLRTYTTEARLVEVAYSIRDGRVPPDLEWRLSADTIYAGQSFAISLDLYNAAGFLFAESVEVTRPARGLFEEISGVGSVSSEEVAGRELLRIPVAVYLFTAADAGIIRIPPAAVNVNGLRVVAPAIEFEALPPPASIQTSGAIGDFALSWSVEPESVGPGESAEIVVRLEGEGNLEFLQLPVPDAADAVLTEISSTITADPSTKGYIGTRETRFRIVPEGESIIEVTMPPFPALDPASGRTTIRPPDSAILRVTQGPAAAGGTAGPLPSPVPRDAIGDMRPMDLAARPLVYLLGLPGLLVLLVVTYVRLRRVAGPGRVVVLTVIALSVLASFSLVGVAVFRADAAELGALETTSLSASFNLLESERFNLAFDGFAALARMEPRHAGYQYNAGVAAYYSGLRAQSIAHLRRAIRLIPASERFRDTLGGIEEDYGLERQVPAPRYVHADYGVIGILASFNLLCVTLAFYTRRRGGLVIVAAGLALLLTLVSVGFLVSGLVHESSNVAVVAANDTAVRRIPDPGSSAGITMPEGTSLTFGSMHRGYYLVTTGFGVQGWLEVDRLLVVP